jgi:hypothetical protein
MRRVLTGLIVLMLAAAPVAAQVQGGLIGGIQGQTPPRDPRQQQPPTGTGRIRGRVTTTEGNQPLRRATVRLNGTGGPNGQRVAVTDADGRYEIALLAAGRYTLTASKAGYINTTSKPIDLADNQRADNINISVPRGGVIAGRVLDEFGDPATGAQVTAMRSAAGQTIGDITISLLPTRLAKITGMSFDSEGRPMARGNVMTMPRSENVGFGRFSGQIKPDGTFVILNVSPGDYSLRATMPPPPPTTPYGPGNPTPRPETAAAGSEA